MAGRCDDMVTFRRIVQREDNKFDSIFKADWELK